MNVIQAPAGSDLAAAAAAEQDASDRIDLAIEACIAAAEEYKAAEAAYELAAQVKADAVEAWGAARKAHLAAMREAGVAQTADGYVTR